MKLIPADDCYKRWGSPSKLKLDSEIKKKGFCVKGINKEMSCKGDSGAPAILEYGWLFSAFFILLREKLPEKY